MARRDAEPAGLSGQLWVEGHRVMPRPALVAWLLGKGGGRRRVLGGKEGKKKRFALQMFD